MWDLPTFTYKMEPGPCTPRSLHPLSFLSHTHVTSKHIAQTTSASESQFLSPPVFVHHFQEQNHPC